ncbi:hypothetical protein SAMN05720606_113169 [Paenibacillus polysaccharolyticus]|uniref:Uncharacterized protein n=1 Tax=Paenibacillus polysaccharolyticus TaxID=582692 RepID=A0A1G5K841_9BACL|nr:hypothetical protein [Paenibacillus polysaccharolyticus]SCY96697.1 hypothetical protein SAMN05720606_113169 [Paenibacillus polysaccharolyticus]
MILYHAINSYQLLTCMIHCKLNHEKDEKIIIISNFLTRKHSNYIQLENLGFNKVIVLNEVPENVSDIEEYFDDIFKNNSISINHFNDIYVSGANGFFGIYLCKRNIEFNLFEESSGIISRPELLINIEENLSLKTIDLCKTYGLYDGKNKLIKDVYCNINAQLEGFYEEKAKHFGVIEELHRLSSDQRNDIIAFFGSKSSYGKAKESVLVLTQHFANLKIMSFEDQILIYQYLVDYFCEKTQVVFKPHPDDLLYYKKLFPESTVIQEKFPSELIPFIWDEKPNTIMTISSSGIANLKDDFEKMILFNSEFEREFKNIHKYYITLKYLNLINNNNESLIFGVGVNENLIQNLVNFSDVDFKNIEISSINSMFDIPENSILLIDDIEDYEMEDIHNFLKCIRKDIVIFFLDCKNEYKYYSLDNKHLFDFEAVIPIVIEKNKIKVDEFYENEKEEVIYLYSRKEGINYMIDEFVPKKILSNTGIELAVRKFTEEELKIKILEGRLEATEKRLLHYIKLTEELSTQLQSYNK